MPEREKNEILIPVILTGQEAKSLISDDDDERDDYLICQHCLVFVCPGKCFAS
jgi:hypothetical protein